MINRAHWPSLMRCSIIVAVTAAFAIGLVSSEARACGGSYKVYIPAAKVKDITALQRAVPTAGVHLLDTVAGKFVEVRARVRYGHGTKVKQAVDSALLGLGYAPRERVFTKYVSEIQIYTAANPAGLWPKLKRLGYVAGVSASEGRHPRASALDSKTKASTGHALNIRIYNYDRNYARLRKVLDQLLPGWAEYPRYKC